MDSFIQVVVSVVVDLKPFPVTLGARWEYSPEMGCQVCTHACTNTHSHLADPPTAPACFGIIGGNWRTTGNTGETPHRLSPKLRIKPRTLEP